MASVFKDQNNGEKASSLDMPEIVDVPKEQKQKRKRDGKARTFSKGSRSKLPLIADILLIVLIVGIIVGAIFGLRALKRAFTPTAETREITFRVALAEMPYDMIPSNSDGSCSLVNNYIWYTDLDDGDKLGTVTAMDFEYVKKDESDKSKTDVDTVRVYLTVTASATYRDSTYTDGAGYYMGDTRVAGGLKGVFRMNGLVSEGEIVSVRLTADAAGGA